jgi:O-acetylhomoserine (thiol)-lyase
MRKKGIMTRALHAGWKSDPATGAFGLPIYLTAGYRFPDAATAARLFTLEEEGHIYSRISNPTVAALETALADLEGGVAAVAFSSGQAAFAHVLAALTNPGDSLLISRKTYGGTLTLIRNVFARYGVVPRFFDPGRPEEAESNADGTTRAILVETIGNPTLDTAPLEELGRIARDRGIPLVVDNTFATPALCRPIEWGAHLVVHSMTKYLCGAGTIIGGALVDGGNFDWEGSGRFPALTEPDPGYAGIRYVEKFGAAAFAARLRVSILRDLGGCPSPFDAYLVRQGLTTLPLRMERHSRNALAVAQHLRDHPQVEWVRYPGLEGDPDHASALRYFPEGAGGMVAFSVRGGVPAGSAFLDALELFAPVANLGDVRSLAIHPASTTHSQISPKDRAASGVGDGLIRLSVGLEDPEDLIEDLDRALREAARAVVS